LVRLLDIMTISEKKISTCLLAAILVLPINQVLPEQFPQYPQGYYPFEESPAKIPPKVRKPPYLQTQVHCPGLNGPGQEQTLDNLCGDLNKGYLPLNPIGQNVEGVSYPFDLLKTKALEYFSKALPILKADDTLPKVAKYENNHISYHPTLFNSKPTTRISFYHHRTKRDAAGQSKVGSPIKPEVANKKQPAGRSSNAAEAKSPVTSSSSRNARADSSKPLTSPRNPRAGAWCKDSVGVFCMLYNVFKGDQQGHSDKVSDRIGGDTDVPGAVSLSKLNSLESPMTPCPSAVEYVTPVFAKNYQGVWRYVVQIPYEGYFTQTVEVVKCLSTKCEYLDGSCLASPRWVSLLVAEIYYPDVSFPNPAHSQNRNPVKGGAPPTDYNQLFLKRQGAAAAAGTSSPPTSADPAKCDGQDELGCYQVRLYYDWFLIPGSCKCWKNDFFDQYNRKR